MMTTNELVRALTGNDGAKKEQASKYLSSFGYFYDCEDDKCICYKQQYTSTVLKVYKVLGTDNALCDWIIPIEGEQK